MFVDTHAHLTDEQFADDIDEIIEKSKDCMTSMIITSGYDLESSKECVKLADKYENVFASIGIYPENADDYDENVERELKNLAKNPKVVAIGEIGLQYMDDMPKKEIQIEVFLKQLKLAKMLEKPVVIHCRDAYGDMLDLLKKNCELLTYGGTLHCYGGSYEIAKEMIKLGLFVSVGGVSTFKNASNVRECIAKLPLEKLLLETDCPYLTPSPYRGKRNDPSFVPTIAENLAQIKGVKVEEVAEITTMNARSLFNI